MQIIWVSTAGNDATGDGTSALPYATIDRAVQDFTSGDQIRILDGTYTPADTLSFVGMDGSIFAENPNEVTIQPAQTLIDSACISVRNADRFSVIGLNIVQASDAPNGNSVGVYAADVTNLRVFTCDIHTFAIQSGSAYGIWVSGGGRIENCAVYDITSSGTQVCGIRTTGIDVVDCSVLALSGVGDCNIVGIDSSNGYFP